MFAFIDRMLGFDACAIYNGYINMCACCSYPFDSTLHAMSIPIYMIPTEGVVGKR